MQLAKIRQSQLLVDTIPCTLGKLGKAYRVSLWIWRGKSADENSRTQNISVWLAVRNIASTCLEEYRLFLKVYSDSIPVVFQHRNRD